MFRSCGVFGAALAALVLLLPVAAQARWLRGESAHFIVYANSGESTLRDYVQAIEDYDHLLRRMHGGAQLEEPGAKLEIYLINGAADLRQVFPEMKGQWAGVYTAGPDGVFAVAFKPSAYLGDTVVKHEYYHHFMWQNFPGGYPGWMVEGMAEFFSSTGRRGGGMIVGGPEPGQLEQLGVYGWIPLDELLSKTPFQFKSSMVGSYYAEAWLLTNYMMTDLERRKQLIAYVGAVRAGEDSVKAWVDKVGEAPEVTQKKLHNFQLKGLLMDKDPPQKLPVAITPMPESADDMLLEGQQLKNGVPEAQRAAVLADVRADAAKHPGDRLSDLVLARAEIELGDRAKAEPLLERRLKEDANDVEARLLQAWSRMKDGDDAADFTKRDEFYRQADRILVPALKVDARDYRVLYAYARSRSVEPGYPSENMVTVLDNAVALAPQVGTLRFAAAQANADRDHFDAAVGLLQPLVGDPHNPGAAKAARSRIEELEKARLADKPKS